MKIISKLLVHLGRNQQWPSEYINMRITELLIGGPSHPSDRLLVSLTSVDISVYSGRHQDSDEVTTLIVTPMGDDHLLIDMRVDFCHSLYVAITPDSRILGEELV